MSEVMEMAQIAINIDDQLAERLDKAVKSSGKSKSKWVAEAINNSLQDEWPEGFFDLAGSWEDDASAEQIMIRIRNGMEMPETREKRNVLQDLRPNQNKS
jgi:predicted DNA-binding protein